MADSSHVFSLVGKNLKLNTKEDIDPHLEDLNRIADLQEIHLGGNTFGVEACRALADVLKTKTNLRVGAKCTLFIQIEADTFLAGCGLCGYLYRPPDLGNSRCTTSAL